MRSCGSASRRDRGRPLRSRLVRLGAGGRRAVRRDYPPLGLLVNNAGMVSTAPSHLGRRLRAHLRDQPPGAVPAHRAAVGSPRDETARIVTVASRIHYRGRLDLADGHQRRAPATRATAAYAQSKLANVLHTFALARRMSDSRHQRQLPAPGSRRDESAAALAACHQAAAEPVVFDAERGARTSLYLALDPSVAGVTGRYFDEYQNPRARLPARERRAAAGVAVEDERRVDRSA